MCGAPILSLSIAGPTTLSLKDYDPSSRLCCTVTATLSYEGALDIPREEPIIFHTFLFRDIDWCQEGFRLYRRDSGQRRPYEIQGSFTHHRYRFSTLVSKNVGLNEEHDFGALNPGESWSFSRQVTDYPDNMMHGDSFRYCFKRAQLDWWDWGHFEDHKETAATTDTICLKATTSVNRQYTINIRWLAAHPDQQNKLFLIVGIMRC